MKIWQIPLSQLMGEACVVDISKKAAENRDYELAVEDLIAVESRDGEIHKNCIVVVRTGWGKNWPNKLEYLGSDTPGDTSNLHFPGTKNLHFLDSKNISFQKFPCKTNS